VTCHGLSVRDLTCLVFNVDTVSLQVLSDLVFKTRLVPTVTSSFFIMFRLHQTCPSCILDHILLGYKQDLDEDMIFVPV